MSAGRRGVLLSAAFLALAAGLAPGGRAHAQFPQGPRGFNGFDDPGAGQHTMWPWQFSPDQVRRLFDGYRKGDPAAAGQLEELLRDSVLKRNPGADRQQVEAAIKKMLGDKEFMDRIADLAQKHRNQSRDPNAPPNPQRMAPDLEQLREQFRKGGNGDPFQVPKIDPDNSDPKQFPHADPANRPRIDPESGLPLGPKTGKPPEPKNPPKPKPLDGPAKVDPERPPPPPRGDPKTGRPPEPERALDPANPLGAPKLSPEQAAKAKAYDTATALWEKNVGPIDETPAVKRAIYDLIADPEAMDALTDAKGNSLFDMFKDGVGDGDGLKGLFDGADGPGWEWPKLDWKLDFGKSPNMDFGASAPKTRWPEGGSRWPSGGSSWGGWGGSFNFGGTQVPFAPLLLVLLAVVAAVVWWKWDALAQLRSGRPEPVGGLGPWPLDPHDINTREDVVKAFEYLSVLICGPAAKTWTHSTVADELAALARTHGGTAMKLARLYELARYAPLDEPLSRAEVLEARRLVCDLAGVD